MKLSVWNRNTISPEVAGLITRLVSFIPWPVRRQAMGDVVLTILDGKSLGLPKMNLAGIVQQ